MRLRPRLGIIILALLAVLSAIAGLGLRHDPAAAGPGDAPAAGR